MELNIAQEKLNELFARKEVQGTINAEVAPKREEVLSVLAQKYSTLPETIKIKNILGKFGSKTFEFSANIYSSKEAKDAVEIKKKKEIEAEKRAEEARIATSQPAETSAENPEEKSVEENREEIQEEKEDALSE